MISCPVCKSKVVWFDSVPNELKYCCNSCGSCWEYELEVRRTDIGNFYGDWTEKEIAHVTSLVRPMWQWNYYKGKTIFSAWSTKNGLKDFIWAESLKRLIYNYQLTNPR